MPDDTTNPSQGGSYARDPVTGTLTPLAQPDEAQPALRRHADDEPDAPAADTSATAVPAAATTSPQPEA